MSSTAPRFDDRCPPVCATDCKQERAQLAREVAQFAPVELAQVGGLVDASSNGYIVSASGCVIQSAISSSRRPLPPNGDERGARLVAQRLARARLAAPSPSNDT